MRAARPPRTAQRGLTILELMIVLAIIGAGMFLVRSGFRMLTKADLVENSSELAAIMRRTSQLAIEHGEMHRVVFELGQGKPEDKIGYVVEVCRGSTAIARNEPVKDDEDAKKRALERGKLKLVGLPSDALSTGDPEEAARRVTAISGKHIADRTCVPATEGITGDAEGKGWARSLRSAKGIKFKGIWVQHLDDPVTKGQVAIYFWPTGSSEKAVIEITDGDEIFTVSVTGITGRVELHDGAPKSVDDIMLRNIMGDKDMKREDQH